MKLTLFFLGGGGGGVHLLSQFVPGRLVRFFFFFSALHQRQCPAFSRHLPRPIRNGWHMFEPQSSTTAEVSHYVLTMLYTFHHPVLSGRLDVTPESLSAPYFNERSPANQPPPPRPTSWTPPTPCRTKKVLWHSIIKNSFLKRARGDVWKRYRFLLRTVPLVPLLSAVAPIAKTNHREKSVLVDNERHSKHLALNTDATSMGRCPSRLSPSRCITSTFLLLRQNHTHQDLQPPVRSLFHVAIFWRSEPDFRNGHDLNRGN